MERKEEEEKEYQIIYTAQSTTNQSFGRLSWGKKKKKNSLSLFKKPKCK